MTCCVYTNKYLVWLLSGTNCNLWIFSSISQPSYLQAKICQKSQHGFKRQKCQHTVSMPGSHKALGFSVHLSLPQSLKLTIHVCTCKIRLKYSTHVPLPQWWYYNTKSTAMTDDHYCILYGLICLDVSIAFVFLWMCGSFYHHLNRIV